MSLNAQDNEGGSDVKELTYSAIGAQPIPSTTMLANQLPKQLPIISSEGTTTISYFATDNAGNNEPPAKNFTVRIDKSTPAVSGVSPIDAATGVALTEYVTAAFSEAMDPTTLSPGTFTLTKQGSSSLVAARVSYDGANTKATLDPDSALEANTTYTATIKGGSTGAKDLAGNALAQDQSWTFTTAPPPDTTAPRVDTMSPANLTTDVARGTSVAATFSEKMDPASITTLTFKLYKCPSTTSTNCTTQVTSVAVGLSTDGLSATLSPYGTPSTLLASKTKYKAVVTTGAKHVAGNVLDQNPSTAGNQEKVWYFATGRT